MARAVIFDMGETLLRFERPGNGTWREFETPGIRSVYHYFIEQGHPMAAHEDTFVETMFTRLAEGWQQATGGNINLRAIDWIAAGARDHNLNLDEQMIVEAATRYARPLREGLTVMPGAVETLAALRQQGYRIGLISNTIWPARLHLEDLAEVHVLPYLEYTLFSGDVGIWKPNPQIFQNMMAALDVEPANAVFVGDSAREDVIGAQTAGMRAIWKQNADFPLSDIAPDAVIQELAELPTILANWHI